VIFAEPQFNPKLADTLAREAEPQFNPKLADTLAREAGIKTAILYSDNPPEGRGYLEKMRSNVQNIVEGLC
jgi:manganese/iron transport system substrate-binding protein